MRSLKECDFKYKTVLVRVDFNVPYDEKGNIADDSRIKNAIPTIKHLISKKAIVLLLTHIGRPKGKVVEELRTDKVAQRLQEILSINPSLAKASLALGTVLSFCGRVAEGVELLLCLTRDLPKSRETVMKYLKHISAKHPMQIEPILGMAELHIVSETYEPALELLWKATQRETSDTDAILRLLDRVAEKNPGMARVQLEMGKVYLKVGSYARASEHLVSAVEADPSISEQGIKFCHDIIAAEPDEIAAYEAIGGIFVRMKRHAAAVTFLSSSSDIRPEIRDIRSDRSDNTP